MLLVMQMQYLQKAKSGNFEYRGRVPKDLRGHFEKGEVVVQLGTDDPQLALDAWARANAATERRFTEARKQSPRNAPL